MKILEVSINQKIKKFFLKGDHILVSRGPNTSSVNGVEFSSSIDPPSLLLFGDKSISRKHLEIFHLSSSKYQDEEKQNEPIFTLDYDGHIVDRNTGLQEKWRIKDLGSKFGSKIIIQRSISSILSFTSSSPLISYLNPCFSSEISLLNGKNVDFSLLTPTSISQTLDLSILTIPIGGVNSFLRVYSVPIRICNTRLVKDDKKFLKDNLNKLNGELINEITVDILSLYKKNNITLISTQDLHTLCFEALKYQLYPQNELMSLLKVLHNFSNEYFSSFEDNELFLFLLFFLFDKKFLLQLLEKEKNENIDEKIEDNKKDIPIIDITDNENEYFYLYHDLINIFSQDKIQMIEGILLKNSKKMLNFCKKTNLLTYFKLLLYKVIFPTCTFLITSHKTLCATVKTLTSLSLGIPMITTSFFKFYLNSISSSSSDALIEYPLEDDYFPIQGEEFTILYPSLSRSILMYNYHILLLDKSDYQYEAALLGCGAMVTKFWDLVNQVEIDEDISDSNEFNKKFEIVLKLLKTRHKSGLYTYNDINDLNMQDGVERKYVIFFDENHCVSPPLNLIQSLQLDQPIYWLSVSSLAVSIVNYLPAALSADPPNVGHLGELENLEKYGTDQSYMTIPNPNLQQFLNDFTNNLKEKVKRQREGIIEEEDDEEYVSKKAKISNVINEKRKQQELDQELSKKIKLESNNEEKNTVREGNEKQQVENDSSSNVLEKENDKDPFYRVDIEWNNDDPDFFSQENKSNFLSKSLYDASTRLLNENKKKIKEKDEEFILEYIDDDSPWILSQKIDDISLTDKKNKDLINEKKDEYNDDDDDKEEIIEPTIIEKPLMKISYSEDYNPIYSNHLTSLTSSSTSKNKSAKKFVKNRVSSLIRIN